MCRDISLRRNDIRSFGRVIPGATSANLGWVELQEVRYQGLDRWNIASPSNTIIVSHAPQLELLKRTSVCITHAGLNTVLESLAQGVPQVAIPAARCGENRKLFRKSAALIEESRRGSVLSTAETNTDKVKW
jgi:UDP:flavonoid glycosyltransferase YjiC (YdhE family)